jgi:3-hydroxyisobutyrate dehydrogenase-like beta-hydroxyacid dehydrogenase
MSEDLFGFIGLGNMGAPMARNASSRGCKLIVHDIAGTADRASDGCIIAQSSDEIARRAKVIGLSLPTIETNRQVVLEIAKAGVAGTVVVDTCTIGIDAAKRNAQILNEAGIQYLDSPVSGLKFRAEEGALVSMVSGPASELKKARRLLEGYSRAVVHVGTEPGQGQRMKVLNNAICIASYVISSEALTYGEAGGLKVREMLEVINESSGQNFATKFLFPKYVATEQYDASGAEAHIIEKDISLFVDGANGEGTPSKAITAAYDVIKAFKDADPLQDQMNIYPYVRGLHKD